LSQSKAIAFPYFFFQFVFSFSFSSQISQNLTLEDMYGTYQCSYPVLVSLFQELFRFSIALRSWWRCMCRFWVYPFNWLMGCFEIYPFYLLGFLLKTWILDITDLIICFMSFFCVFFGVVTCPFLYHRSSISLWNVKKNSYD
jgi:hypothetical protein